MIKTLVATYVDLSSSRAIRFACRLGSLIDIEIQPVYVKESLSLEPATGSGWARHTWEREILHQGEQEMAELMSSEEGFCPMVRPPEVLLGDREAELLRVMDETPYDLFIEGVDFTWNASSLHKKLQSRLYQRLRCPVILARGVSEIRKVLILCHDSASIDVLAACFQRLWADCATPLHLAIPVTDQDSDGFEKVAVQDLERAGNLLTESRCDVTIVEIPEENSDMRERFLGEFDLVAAAVPKHLGKAGRLSLPASLDVSLLIVMY